MTTLYWFRRDRRLSDNPALLKAIGMADTLLPLTLHEPQQITSWGFARLGPHRQTFEAQSLAGLAQQLSELNSALYQPTTPGITGLIELAREVQTKQIVCQSLAAPEEQQELQALRAAGLTVTTIEQAALLPHDRLPFAIEQTPTIFTEFRHQIERAGVRPRTPVPAPLSLPPLPQHVPGAHAIKIDPYEGQSSVPRPDARSSFPYQTPPWHGSETCAQNHLLRYFASDDPQRYKQTRNALTGVQYSTKFSPWLALGAMSAAQIVYALKEHESNRGANDSTYWIWFELLWRDHFRLMMQRFGESLFRPSGLSQQKRPAIAITHQGFERWQAGQTGHRLIDAGMRELASTGYLSNRMRQIVASYLIHELQGDWLAGAAWFEHCLIDFDIHSNQGNWAYIAGVGTDPRGGRQFNPDKQGEQHDRDGHYRQLWSTP